MKCAVKVSALVLAIGKGSLSKVASDGIPILKACFDTETQIILKNFLLLTRIATCMVKQEQSVVAIFKCTSVGNKLIGKNTVGNLSFNFILFFGLYSIIIESSPLLKVCIGGIPIHIDIQSVTEQILYNEWLNLMWRGRLHAFATRAGLSEKNGTIHIAFSGGVRA